MQEHDPWKLKNKVMSDRCGCLCSRLFFVLIVHFYRREIAIMFSECYNFSEI